MIQLDALGLTLLIAFASAVGALIGGGMAYAMVSATYTRIVRSVEVEAELTALHVSAPVTIDLAVNVPEMATIVVPVEGELVTASPYAELAARLDKFLPDLTVRALADILGVSVGSAQSYRTKARSVTAQVQTSEQGSPIVLAITENVG